MLYRRSGLLGVSGISGDVRVIMPAAEWLLDNFRVVADQIHEIKDDLAPGCYHLFPKLSDRPLQSYPRVFGVSWALVAHTDSATEQGAGQ
jgi:cyclic beta-1,2-glucan synthetase